MNGTFRPNGGGSTDLTLQAGERLTNIVPINEDLYDKEETGPLFNALTEHGAVTLFEDEIEWDAS